MGALEDIDQQYPDDHSSVGSYSLVTDENQSINDDEDESNITSSESDESVQDVTNQPNVAVAKPSSLNRMYKVAKLGYRDFVISIFTDNQDEPRRFFFEPIALLDPSTVTIESDHFLKQHFVRFKIKMWTKEFRSKVLDRIRSIYSAIQLEDISVMPYEKLKLVLQPGGSVHPSVRLVEKETSYKRLSEMIPFYFSCDSEDSASILAGYLRENPEFMLERCQLALECDGLDLESRSISPEKSSSNRLKTTFSVSTLPIKTEGKIGGTIKRLLGSISPVNPLSAPVIICMMTLIGCFLSPSLFFQLYANQVTLESRMRRSMKDGSINGLLLHTDTRAKNSKNFVPVFSVTTAFYKADTINQFIPFASFDIDTKTEHGDFNLHNGIFTVKTAGIYQFHFSGHILFNRGSNWDKFIYHLEIRVNDKARAVSYSSGTSGYSNGMIQPVDISAFIQLSSGDKVGVFRLNGYLHDDFSSLMPDFNCRFSCILYSV